MNTGKLKNIMIILLVIVNVILFQNVAARYITEISSKNELYQNLITIFDERGITLATDIDFDISFDINTYEVTRRHSEEAKIAQLLIGDNFETNNGTGDVRYENENFQAVFLTDGTLDITYPFAETVPNTIQQAESIVVKLMVDMGLLNSQYSYTILQQGDLYIANITRNNNGYEVFNSNIEVILNTKGDCSISGKWFLDADEIYDTRNTNPNNIYDIFLNGADSLPEISQILDFEFGYSLISNNTEKTQIIPTFKYVTDIGVFHLNALGQMVYAN